MNEINYFQKILEHQYPNHFNQISLTMNAYSNYKQYLGRDGRMRAELNYNSSKQDITITFPSRIDGLYYDISSFIRFVWGINDVMAEFDSDGINYFKFTV
jgi:hypothetical protein